MWEEIDTLLEELIHYQRNQLLRCGKRLVPQLTEEDLWQPNDFPELESHPHFRYEEGVLAGIQTVQMAFFAFRKCLAEEGQ